MGAGRSQDFSGRDRLAVSRVYLRRRPPRRDAGTRVGGTRVQRPLTALGRAGALVRLGPIRGNRSRVEVPASAYCGSLCGHWMTLVIERTEAGWEATGTTGPVAIA
jgi:hypothetical protein